MCDHVQLFQLAVQGGIGVVIAFVIGWITTKYIEWSFRENIAIIQMPDNVDGEILDSKLSENER